MPTKQRAGDQALPDGGGECVQDIVIAAMEESKKVGTERYGTPLMTFNGRKGFQDLVEEARDFFVYASMIQAESEADRDALVNEVARALVGDTLKPVVAKAIAEIAVDRIMGWVTAQRVQMRSEA